MIWVIVREIVDGYGGYDIVSYHTTRESAAYEVDVLEYQDKKANEVAERRNERYDEYVYHVHGVVESTNHYETNEDVHKKLKTVDAEYEERLERAQAWRRQYEHDKKVEEEIRRGEEMRSLRNELQEFMDWWKGGVNNDAFFEEKRIARSRRIAPVFQRYLVHAIDDEDVLTFYRNVIVGCSTSEDYYITRRKFAGV